MEKTNLNFVKGVCSFFLEKTWPFEDGEFTHLSMVSSVAIEVALPKALETKVVSAEVAEKSCWIVSALLTLR